MSPVLKPANVRVPAQQFLRYPADAATSTMTYGFPPTIRDVSLGIEAYRSSEGLVTQHAYPYGKITKALIDRVVTVPVMEERNGEIVEAERQKWRVTGVKTHQIAGPIRRRGEVEGYYELMLATIAAALASHRYIGTGDKENSKLQKTLADTAATQAMKIALGILWMKGIIRGGEGGGRDSMDRSAALYMGDLVGRQEGPEIHFLVDPLEVTNATKILDALGSWGKVGHGWSPELNDPANWFAGYSGASSLMLAVNATKPGGGIRELSDFLYIDKLQVVQSVAFELKRRGLTLTSNPEKIVKTVASVLNVPVEKLVPAGLARARHLKIMEAWVNAGVNAANILTPSDGDAMFACAIAAGALHFAGLTGGVMEAVISAAFALVMGIETFMQFVSHDRLGEHKDQADLLNNDHRHGYSDMEYEEMLQTSLFDSEHIGHTLRLLAERGKLVSYINNAATSEDTPAIIPGFNYYRFRDEYDAVVHKREEGLRFSELSREFLKGALLRQGFLDVRDIHTFTDIVKDKDWLALASFITPNRWAPGEGIRVFDNGNRKVVDTLVAGGSNYSQIMEAELVRIN